MKRWAWLVLVAAGLAGCGGGGGTAVSGGVRPASAGGGPTPLVGMVSDVGGVGDQSFNMMANAGLERAKSELGLQTTLIESRQASDYESNLERLAQKGCRVVFAVGFALEPAVKKVAERYPGTHFAIIDAEGPKAPNVTGITFREEEGSFLAGALAGRMTKTKKIGFVGGMEIPLIKRFESGFTAGVATTNAGASVAPKYTNEWENVQKGRELALALYGD
ncbi:MAG TPA: BMP family ABC transporter substrate-binding protein, partial [Armatimonadota bacterium]|nr:BMP family ABC transporter substrate-binding protein [Armatimonadota bacterium]